jgi:hypothetical protein
MLVLQHAFKIALLPLLIASCGHRTAGPFLVHPDPQNAYLLRTPDSREIPVATVLRDYNGFVAGKGWIDLRPLMELRVENAYYQPGASRRGLDGYLGTEVARYRVEPKGLKLASVEQMKDRPPADSPVQDLITNRVAHARFYRLYYEVFNPATNTRVSVLLSANSPRQMEALAATIDRAEAFCNSNAFHCASFPEACSVSVEMQVSVNGKPESLVWGTLLPAVVGEHPKHVELRRLFQGRLQPVEFNVERAEEVRFPILPGDEIKWD